MHRSLIALLLLVATTQGATYYVATTGNNANAGSQAQPWAQIRWASSNVVAGDTVRVQAGTYTERVFETTDGSSGSRITYVADGQVIVRGGFQISGDYVSIIGFLVTHSNALDTYNYEGIQVSSSTVGTWIIKNNVFQCDEACIDFGSSCHNSLVYGNTITLPSASAAPTFNADANHCIRFGASGTNLWIGYNRMDVTPDYISLGGQWIYLLNNVAGTNDDNAVPHVDFFQFDSGASDILIEANYHYGNRSADNHFNHFDDATANRVRLRFNVDIGKGGYSFYGSDNNRFYNNTLASNSWTSSTFQIYAATGTDDFDAWNNIFYYCNPAAGGAVWAGTPSYWFNQSYGQPSYSAGTGDLTSDPLFVSISTYNVTLQSGSPARGTGTNITLANGAGSSTTSLVVDDAYGLFPGDAITVGGVDAVVQSVTSATAITLASAISWSDNAVILLRGITDRGAYPYGSGSTLTASMTQSGTTYTVVPSSSLDCRGVLFYVDGVPQWPIDSSSPFQLTSAGVVTAEALQLYASTNLWASAVLEEPSAAPSAFRKFNGIRIKP